MTSASAPIAAAVARSASSRGTCWRTRPSQPTRSPSASGPVRQPGIVVGSDEDRAPHVAIVELVRETPYRTVPEDDPAGRLVRANVAGIRTTPGTAVSLA